MKKLQLLFLLCVVTLVGSCHKKDKETTTVITPNSFLSSSQYEKLIIEIQQVSGYELTDQTINNLVSFLEQRLNKPGGIQVVKTTVGSGGKSVWSLSDLADHEKANRTQITSGNTITAYFYVVDGEYTESTSTSKILGIAYSSSAMAIFGKSIQIYANQPGQPSPTAIETTVIEHEFGHILGLVNNGTSMQVNHQDTDNGKHCNNTSCLMYYNINSSESMTSILNGGIPSLDNNCINDLQANGGK
ncbi:MAG TPA: hypothetical protein VNB90_00950 [Cytophagaceae bacterium]|jgi:hypothetical protein|nr:hypothetical protein [Cytophagaceae bacterium]